MVTCRKCGRPVDAPLTVRVAGGPEYQFDTFDCAIEMLAPHCPECDRMYTHAPAMLGEVALCSTECARRRQIRDAWSTARGEGEIDGTGSTPPQVGAPIEEPSNHEPPHQEASSRVPSAAQNGSDHAEVGDLLMVHSRTIDRPPRRATILELRGPDGSPPYVVRWHDDDHVSLCFPGSDATIEHRHVAHAG